MRDYLTSDEVDHVMANIHPCCRRWGCRPIPGEPEGPVTGCACPGCIGGALSWDEWTAWIKREEKLGDTPFIEYQEPAVLTLQDRLANYKASKQL